MDHEKSTEEMVNEWMEDPEFVEAYLDLGHDLDSMKKMLLNRTPNAVTIAAMEEGRRMDSKSARFKNSKELFEHLGI